MFVNGDIRFSIEELVAQLLQTAKEYAETAVGQPITECVITVPGFFGQAERLAMLAAARLANVKVLQLINDYAGVALNYGVFQRKEINETASYYSFYDMGAYKTTASIVSYQLVKDKQTREMTPVITVLGVAHDRTLGGLEMQLRLRDHLAKEFNAQKKTKTDVFTNARAMAKLFKEAGRVKNVLSANADIYAQIEGLLDEQDFKVIVSRETFETLCADLFARVPKVLEAAVAASGLSLDVVSQVVLFGGNTRVPKVQETLKAMLGRELAKNLNSDEAATMGAVYKAADLGTGFKVKRYIVKDAVLYPIQVTFEKEQEPQQQDKPDENNQRWMRRTLFGKMNPYPQKKVITFNKHSQDFVFHVNYAVQDVQSEQETIAMGSLNLTRVQLSGVKEALKKNTGEKAESKGIKAHFALDDSGIFSVVNVELVVEKTVTAADEDEADDEGEKNPFTILGSTISKLFSKDKEEDPAETKTDTETPEEPEEENKQKTEEGDAEGTANKTTDDSSTANGTTTEGGEAAAKNKTEPKIKTVKHAIENEVTPLYIVPLDGDEMEVSRKKIETLNKEDQVRHRRERLINELESFVVDAVQKLEEDEYRKCATDAEAEKIRSECAKVSDWLYEEGIDADADTYEKKLKELKGLTNDMFARHWEHQERPEALTSLNKLLDQARGFWKTSLNFTKDSNAEMDVFTQVEVETLEKLIVKTEEWRTAEKKEQDKLKKNEPVKLTVNAMVEKMQALDRELKYMANKMKYWKPKTPKKTEKKKKEGEEDKDKEKDGEDKEKKVNDEEEEKAQVDEPPVTDEETVTSETAEEEGAEGTPHGEL